MMYFAGNINLSPIAGPALDLLTDTCADKNQGHLNIHKRLMKFFNSCSTKRPVPAKQFKARLSEL